MRKSYKRVLKTATMLLTLFSITCTNLVSIFIGFGKYVLGDNSHLTRLLDEGTIYNTSDASWIDVYYEIFPEKAPSNWSNWYDWSNWSNWSNWSDWDNWSNTSFQQAYEADLASKGISNSDPMGVQGSTNNGNTLILNGSGNQSNTVTNNTFTREITYNADGSLKSDNLGSWDPNDKIASTVAGSYELTKNADGTVTAKETYNVTSWNNWTNWSNWSNWSNWDNWDNWNNWTNYMGQFQITAVRDIAWKAKYFNPTTGSYIGATSTAEMPLKTYNNKSIKSGYAVDFRFTTQGLPKDNTTTMNVNVEFLDESGAAITIYDLTKQAPIKIEPNSKYTKLAMSAADSSKTTDLDGSTDYFSKSVKQTAIAQELEWQWSYYLPPIIGKADRSKFTEPVTVRFTLNVYRNGLQVGTMTQSVFKYDPEKSLLEDITGSSTY